MNTIFKYPLRLTDEQEIEMPFGAEVIHCGLDAHGEPCVWAKVESENSNDTRTIYVVGTGEEIPPYSDYLGSVVQDPFVWHIFIKEQK